jgi:hypothetical protein
LPAQRCEFCPERPYQEVAVLKWRGEERERLTVQICARHLARLSKAGAKGWPHKDFLWKVGFW